MLRSVTDPASNGILGVERSVLDRDSFHDSGANGADQSPGPTPRRDAPGPARARSGMWEEMLPNPRFP
jgi:hypothetical protein